ncbi:VOC family protein [Lutimaribacter saemankumensis]|uniref:Catechol 2,3-dioxygenase n=1 Tax=Lutimaribacter saemankumensis TaxID=490829 RepID=A0A1G8LGF9_9RHOB|nr:VOC family protein [Lutimaribacter saemankumensis]SDI54715.1 Catechol 2,3-dioxygenase [Lutimaribacter saemankumensis]
MTHNDLPAAPTPDVILEGALYAPDLDAAEAFYGGVLNLEKITRAGDRHVFFRVGAGVLLIFNPDETEMPPGNTQMPVPSHGARGPGHFCFGVDTAALTAWQDRLEAAGVEIEADFKWPNGARSIYFRDPAGNSVEMAEPRLWSR